MWERPQQHASATGISSSSRSLGALQHRGGRGLTCRALQSPTRCPACRLSQASNSVMAGGKHRRAASLALASLMHAPPQAAKPDSPIVITAADFTEMRLDVAPGRYNWEGPHSMEILNVSDRPVHDVHFGPFISWAGTSGGSDQGIGMWRYQQALAPGQRVTVARKGGGETGTSPRGDDVTVDLSVRSVRIGPCQFRPSLALPLQRP